MYIHGLLPYSNISLSVSQSTHNNIELCPLYRILVGLSIVCTAYVCMYVCSKLSNIYTLYQTLVGLYVYLSTYKAINLYPLYRTIVGLSMYFSTQKAIELYTHYRAMVSLTVYYQGLYSNNYI